MGDEHGQRLPLRILVGQHRLHMPFLSAQGGGGWNLHTRLLPAVGLQPYPFSPLSVFFREHAGKRAVLKGIGADHAHQAVMRRTEAPQNMACLIQAQGPARFAAARASGQVPVG